MKFSNAVSLGAFLLAVQSIASPLIQIASNADAPDIKITLKNITYRSVLSLYEPKKNVSGFGTIDFDVTSSQTPKSNCRAISSGDDDESDLNPFFRYKDPIWGQYHCEYGVGGEWPANFTFSRWTEDPRITVNLTFPGPTARYGNGCMKSKVTDRCVSGAEKYVAEASGNTKLECKTEMYWQNPSWTAEDIGKGVQYSSKNEICKGPDLELRIDRVRPKA
jgi:hypothetical protein